MKPRFLKRGQLILFSVFMVLNSFTGVSSKTNSDGEATSNSPVFSKFIYVGDDQVYKDNLLAADEFYNPILQGCYPDPAICRKGDDYFLVCSSCTYP